MAYLSACIVAHLRADTTPTVGLVALLGSSTRINHDYDTELSPELPQVYIVPRGGGDETTSAATARFVIWVEGGTRAICSSVHDRIRYLLHMKSNFTLGAAPNTVVCTRAQRQAPHEFEDRNANDPFEAFAFYDFHVAASHGF